jgi:hypothetical protein
VSPKKLEPAGRDTFKRQPVVPTANFSTRAFVVVKPPASTHEVPEQSEYRPKCGVAMATLEIIRADTMSNRTFFIAAPLPSK